jgi:S1/P1 Nuclease
MHFPQRLLLSGLVSLPGVLSWGILGHQTVAWIAQSLISDDTASFVKSTLESSRTDYMANISTWAESYRYTSAGAWSAPLHYIDANDSPPGECDVEFNRDCGESGCVVSALVNYTNIVMDTGASADERRDALRFVIHFAGDIHQPLHVENIERGGNGINVTFAGKSNNLHHLWDTEIPEKIADGLGAKAWAQTLVDDINNGNTFGNVSAWGQDISLDDTEATTLSWADDANDFVCTDVLPDGVAAVEEGDLSNAYFDAHGQVAKLQIAKAGYRLAKYLDLIASASN